MTSRHHHKQQQQHQQQQHQQQRLHQQEHVAAAAGAPVDFAPAGPVLALAAQSKRKEKARLAARARRSQETNIIMDMAQELHITQEKMRRLDKATIVKLAIDYIKAFEILCRLRSIRSVCGNIDGDDDTNGANVTEEQQQRRRNFTTATNDEAAGDQSNYEHTNEDYNHAITHITGNIKIENNHDNQQIQINNIEQQQQQQQQQHQQPATISFDHANPTIDRGQYPDQEQHPIPEFNTDSIFAHKTEEVDSHFLVIKEHNGRPAFVLKPDREIMEEDDLTHLAPQAGDSVSLEVEPLDGIVVDSSLFKICGCRY